MCTDEDYEGSVRHSTGVAVERCSVRRTAEAIGLGRELRDDEIALLDEGHAGTYGIPF